MAKPRSIVGSQRRIERVDTTRCRLRPHREVKSFRRRLRWIAFGAPLLRRRILCSSDGLPPEVRVLFVGAALDRSPTSTVTAQSPASGHEYFSVARAEVPRPVLPQLLGGWVQQMGHGRKANTKG